MVSLKSKSLFPIFHVLLLVVLVLAWSGAAVSSGFTVRSLPGFKGPLPFHLETGYVGVGEGGDVQLFYYFIHSERNPKEDPLVLWLVGGPRCTALHGITYEIGPLHFKAADSNGSLPNLVLNPDSWTQVANVIFLDAPVGTGFSYWRTAERFLISDTISARHTNQFLQNWLTDHPQFLSNPLYIGGDSYSGVVNPVIVEELINGIEAGKEPRFNFKGYFLGNPLTSPYLENDAQVPFAHRMGLISDELYESIKKNCKLGYTDFSSPNMECLKDQEAFNECVLGINRDCILEPSCYTIFSAEPKVSRRSRRSLASIGKYKNSIFSTCRESYLPRKRELCQELVAMARTKITSRQDNDQMKLKLVSNEELLKNKRKPPNASNRRKNKKVAMDFEKTYCDEVEAENSEIRMDVNETENVDGGNSSHLVARDGSGDNNDGEGMEEDVYGEGMEEAVDGESIEEDVDGEGIEEDVDNDGENESDGDQSKEMEEVEANKKRKGKAQTKDLEANEGKFCGGPTDSSILYGYKCYVGRDVWIGKERGVIRCIQHLAKLDQWKLENECQGFHKKLRETGLHGLVFGV